MFVSAASNLVANDNNNAPDVFVRDTQSGTTTLVTVDAAGGSATVPGGSAGSYDPVISDDGRYVAFVSTASNLSGADSGDGGRRTCSSATFKCNRGRPTRSPC